MEDKDCICVGNWRLIVKEAEPFFGKWFTNKYTDYKYRLIGVLHAEDDYYYAFSNEEGEVTLWSCVGNIETNGFTEMRS